MKQYHRSLTCDRDLCGSGGFSSMRIEHLNHDSDENCQIREINLFRAAELINHPKT